MTITNIIRLATDAEVLEATLTMAALGAQARDPAQPDPSTEDYEVAVCQAFRVIFRVRVFFT